jgi:hypothetical protein
MNNIVITIVLVLGLFLFVVFLTNTIIIYAQQQMPPSSNTPPHTPSSSPKAVKIISPTKGQQMPVGKDLTISGTSTDNATSNCQVSMSVNHVKPYQPATAAGIAGANDYSKWNFVLTSNYATIKPGPDNRITAKYTCTDNPAMLSPTYSSVNVTGVMDAASTTSTAAATTTTTPTANLLLQQQQQQQKQQTMTTSNNATTISNGNPNKATPQYKPSLTMGNNNTAAIVNSVSTLPPPVPTPANTLDSGKLLYLGINSKSANKDDNTKSAIVHHSSSSNDDNSFDTTTKIKTQHTSSSSDKPTKKTNTFSNNIAEHHSIKPSTTKVKTSHSSDKSTNSDKSTKTMSITSTDTEHHSIKPSTTKVKTSHSSDKSNDGGRVIDSEFGHSDPLSEGLDHMSDTLDHLFG